MLAYQVHDGRHRQENPSHLKKMCSQKCPQFQDVVPNYSHPGVQTCSARYRSCDKRECNMKSKRIAKSSQNRQEMIEDKQIKVQIAILSLSINTRPTQNNWITFWCPRLGVFNCVQGYLISSCSDTDAQALSSISTGSLPAVHASPFLCPRTNSDRFEATSPEGYSLKYSY